MPHWNFTRSGPKRAQIWLYDQIGNPAEDAAIARKLAPKFAAKKPAADAGQPIAADLMVYDDIGEWGLGAKEFAQQLKDLGAVDQIDVRINSYGGSVFDGFAIYNMLQQHPANVTTWVDGLAASIASVIAMAGNTVQMGSASRLMIHNALGCVFGFAKDMRAQADVLDSLSASICGIYAEATGLDPEELQGWMDAETWLTADQAVEKGFADAKVGGEQVAACLWRPAWAERDPAGAAPSAATGPTAGQLRLLHERLAEARRAEKLTADSR